MNHTDDARRLADRLRPHGDTPLPLFPAHHLAAWLRARENRRAWARLEQLWAAELQQRREAS